MLPCQRDLFEIPPDVCYLNSAAYAPLPRAVRDAGQAGVAQKSTPWTLRSDASHAMAERARAAAAALLGAAADDIAITAATSYGIATAGLNLALPPGCRVLMVDNEFPSLRLEWQRQAALCGATVDVVPRPADNDWTAALRARIDAPGPPVGLAALHAQGAAIVVDATQAAGVMPIDVRAWQADFVAFPTYKWVLGPYSLGFLYAAPHRQDGRPLEQHGISRDGGAFLPGARRYDVGERNNPVALPMAAAGMELVGGWGGALAARLRHLTDLLAAAAAPLGYAAPPRHLRAPHILGLRRAGGLPPGLIDRLAAAGVHVSDRSGVLRVSPHAYNDETDVARFAEALRAADQATAAA
jgi:selenocysteine lyase/cysteine desulfurase